MYIGVMYFMTNILLFTKFSFSIMIFYILSICNYVHDLCVLVFWMRISSIPHDTWSVMFVQNLDPIQNGWAVFLFKWFCRPILNLIIHLVKYQLYFNLWYPLQQRDIRSFEIGCDIDIFITTNLCYRPSSWCVCVGQM